MSSILADIDIALESGNLEVLVVNGNEDNSELRRAFSIDSFVETPFTITEMNGEDVFTVGGYKYAPRIQADNANVGEFAGFQLDKIKIDNGLTINSSTGVFTGSDIAGEIYCNGVEITADTIKDTAFYCGSRSISDNSVYYGLPYISVDSMTDTCMVLENVGLNIYTYNPAAVTVNFCTCKMPKFVNVTSEGIDRIKVYYTSNKLFTANNKAVWNKLFNFGYSIYTEDKEIVIDTMHDLYKACCNKKVWSKIFDAIPYRLNKDVKLTDIIDVAGFESYQNDNLTVTIYDNKFGIIITKDTKCLKTYYEDMFKGKDVTMKDITEGIVDVPKTADGYYVIPFRS